LVEEYVGRIFGFIGDNEELRAGNGTGM
jgi:hypothetical protein